MLHPRLEADTRALGETPGFWLRWMNDQRFPWVIIVPRQSGVREWHELAESDQQDLLALVNRCSLHLQRLTGADKMNIGALGNVVPQLHVHIIARHEGDACWPAPVWGQGAPEPWDSQAQPDWLPALRDALSWRCA